MDDSSIQQLIILLVLLLLSAFFSSAETALTTVNRHKMRALKEQGNKRAARVLALLEQPSKMLSAILIGNNIVNLSASSLATSFAIKLARQLGMGSRTSTFIGLATGILTLLVLLFGEIIPKTMASEKSESMAMLYSRVVGWITWILTPVIFIIDLLSSSLCSLFGIRRDASRMMTEMELRTIVDVSREDGVIEEEEKEMINNVVDFGDSLSKDIMVPRIDMVFASTAMTAEEIADLFVEEQYSRLPVYEKTKDKVIGILNLKDFFFDLEKKGREHFDIQRVMRKPLFTYEFQKTSVLMEEMRAGHTGIAIVLDEYGVTAGMITLEDLIEEIIGDIRDEFDGSERDSIRRTGKGEYEIEGSVRLADINDRLNIHIESEDYDSIGGHMIELLGHFPEEGEAVREGSFLFMVRKMDNNRISTVYMKVFESGNEVLEQ